VPFTADDAVCQVWPTAATHRLLRVSLDKSTANGSNARLVRARLNEQQDRHLQAVGEKTSADVNSSQGSTASAHCFSLLCKLNAFLVQVMQQSERCHGHMHAHL
jgi:hypothetical protein